MMKRKDSNDQEAIARLQARVEELFQTAERLAGAAEHSRLQIDRLEELLERAEEILKRQDQRGLSIEGLLQPQEPIDDEPQTDDLIGETEFENNAAAQSSHNDSTANFGFGHFIEFSTYEEYKKFQDMAPINDADLLEVDVDELIEQILRE